MAILRLPQRSKREPRPSRRGDDDAGVARCPKCDRPMALRYGRREVVFVCGCGERPVLRHKAA
jgi:ssDNA-binding Zn-finger/Zn-ribbon topoisomerase 1